MGPATSQGVAFGLGSMRETQTRGEVSLRIYWHDGNISGDVIGERVVAGLGFFDGVHLGHQAILTRVQELAKTINGIPMAITFDRHPISMIRPDAVPKLLTDCEERRQYMWDNGIKAIAELVFDESMVNLEPERFATDILVSRLGVVAVAAGEDFRFGCGGRGGIELLHSKGHQWGIDMVEVVDSVVVEGAKVSSTRIRGLLEAGMVEDAGRLLGRPYRLSGQVVEGEGRGRELGFPTANLAVAPERLMPKDGVYAVTVRHLTDNRQKGHAPSQRGFLGVLSISNKPTFAGKSRAVEVHVLEQDADYYGKRLVVSFHTRLRPIHRFDNAEKLQEQIVRDIQVARKLSMRLERGPIERIYTLGAL